MQIYTNRIKIRFGDVSGMLVNFWTGVPVLCSKYFFFLLPNCTYKFRAFTLSPLFRSLNVITGELYHIYVYLFSKALSPWLRNYPNTIVVHDRFFMLSKSRNWNIKVILQRWWQLTFAYLAPRFRRINKNKHEWVAEAFVLSRHLDVKIEELHGLCPRSH